MKILAFTPLFLPSLGGIEILVDGLAKALRPRGITTVVVTDNSPNLAEFEIVNSTPVHRLALSGAIRTRQTSAPLGVLSRLAKIVTKEAPDILHLHSVTQASAFYVDRIISARSPRIPLIVTQHGLLEPQDRLEVVRRLLQKADALTAVSQAALESAVCFSERQTDLYVIPNGIGAEAATLTVTAPEPGQPYRLVCVGRLQLEKGFDLAIEALAIMCANGMNVELTIVGRGEEEQRFALLAQRLEVGGHVHFKGALAHAEARREIANAHLLVAPSRTREGFGLVVAEAALAGVPSIVANTGGLAETVEDELTGIVVPPNNAVALAAATKRLLESPQTWQEMSVRSRERAAERFCLDRCADKYAALFNGHRNWPNRRGTG